MQATLCGHSLPKPSGGEIFRSRVTTSTCLMKPCGKELSVQRRHLNTSLAIKIAPPISHVFVVKLLGIVELKLKTLNDTKVLLEEKNINYRNYKKLCSLCLISFKLCIGKKVVICEEDQPFCYRLLAKIFFSLLRLFHTNYSAKRFFSLQSCDSFPLLLEASTNKRFNEKTTFVSIATCLCVRIIL